MLCFVKGLGYVQKHETDVFVLVESFGYVFGNTQEVMSGRVLLKSLLCG